MSISSPIKIATDNLVFYYNTDSARSYVGAPTSNLFYTPTPDSSGAVSFVDQGAGTFYRVFSGNYGGYDIKPTDVVYRMDLSANNYCWYHGNSYNVPSGYSVTFAFDYYISPNAVNYGNTNYLANIENVGNGLAASIADPTPSTIGVWKRAVMTPAGTSNGSGVSKFLLYPGACGGYLASSGYILYKNPQAEPKAYSTPFIMSGASSTGSRSNTQGLLDMNGNYDINLTSAGFGSSGTPTFVAANSNYIYTSAGFKNFETGITGEFWAYFTSTSYSWERLMDFGNGQNLDNIVFSRSGTANDLYVGFYNTSGTLVSLLAAGYITNGAFGHYVFTADGSTLKIYKNGIQVASTNTSYLPTSVSRTNTYIGRSNWADSYFQGSIPVARLYNRALTSTEIMNNYNTSKGRFGL